jgi:hypothetical protein
MSDTTQTNAMAEIALALAMGFFSIMVLTMVSMGSGLVVQEAKPLQEDAISIAKTQDKSDQSQAKGKSENVAPEDLIIFHKGVFYDNKLTPVSIASISARPKVILAVAPDLSMSQTLEARHQISNTNITVVVLNESWVNAIKEAKL